mmetsp:Transcript_21756/g.28164  ORF Transcript_21756/g.28164 Transcript_21756/m.28164 type:complete len:671 (+) Transcript_21756:119-2131(+)|eukprot:CAMPEP_0197288648 /NCGR_PEP_ID=MMETSP0890-20130614/5790_1 /TAXON_ID=44058 ORGANISM="Aureoumbra lagunensis, Strain CCMP1510" /NCGR_SAMPLE_ID=MMETSP0890 /ASSEMBLY_ACC=CAM_ASM_000533 /LENGTH=670 /DNA_ID=CAMNT_0042759537 /DNA_START=49 /DNA_END=2061 /DNA_ORIENTATION=-
MEDRQEHHHHDAAAGMMLNLLRQPNGGGVRMETTTFIGRSSGSDDDKKDDDAMDVAPPERNILNVSETYQVAEKNIDENNLDDVAEDIEDLDDQDGSGNGGTNDMNDKRKAKPRRWTDAEDAALVAGVDKFGERRWKAIAAGVGSRDHMQCLQRWKKVLKRGLAKGQWTREEDELIREAMRERVLMMMNNNNNTGIPTSMNNISIEQIDTFVSETNNSERFDWGSIAAKLPLRSAREVRERWKYALSGLAQHRHGTDTPSASPAYSTRSYIDNYSPEPLLRTMNQNTLRSGGASLMTPSLGPSAQTPSTTIGSPSPLNTTRYIGPTTTTTSHIHHTGRPPAYPSWNVNTATTNINAAQSSPLYTANVSSVDPNSGYHHSSINPQHIETRLNHLQRVIDSANAEIASIRHIVSRLSPIMGTSTPLQHQQHHQLQFMHHHRSAAGLVGTNTPSGNESLLDSPQVSTQHHHQGQGQQQATTDAVDNGGSSLQHPQQTATNSNNSEDSSSPSNNQNENLNQRGNSLESSATPIVADTTRRYPYAQSTSLPQAWPLNNRYQQHQQQQQQQYPFPSQPQQHYEHNALKQQQQQTAYYSAQQQRVPSANQASSYVTPPQHYYNYTAHHPAYSTHNQQQQQENLPQSSSETSAAVSNGQSLPVADLHTTVTAAAAALS